MEEVARRCGIPFMAIGGMTVRARAKCAEAGAYGVAVISSILSAPTTLRDDAQVPQYACPHIMSASDARTSLHVRVVLLTTCKWVIIFREASKPYKELAS